MDLAELLSKIARADRDAFESLYVATKAKLFGIILRIIYNQEDAAEVLQEVYVRIWNRAEHYAPDKAAPMTWMIAIARNRALDWRRRVKVEVPMDDLPWLENLADDSPTPLQQTIAHDRARRLGACIGQLDEQQQQCMVLAYLEGLTHQELADRMERPLGTIKSWIRRSLTRLKMCLEQ